MAIENDQARWVGIRPAKDTDPMPVTESAPLTDILVAPSAGNPQFQTLTKKRAPAISDLQAIKVPFDVMVEGSNKNCTVLATLNMPVVSPGELCVITQISLINWDSMCDILIRASVTGVSRVVAGFYSVAAGNYANEKVLIVLPVGGAIRSAFRLGGASDDIEMNIIGYITEVY